MPAGRRLGLVFQRSMRRCWIFLDTKERQAICLQKKPSGRLIELISEKGRFERLLKVSDSEPPRVRAMLGAIGEQLGKGPRTLQRLRASLNSLSRFDFGLLAALDHAQHWQAKERR